MNHIFIILHFVCFSSGISLITILYILNNKNKSQIIKSLVFADIFYTMLLFLDTINLYVRKLVINNYAIIHKLVQLIQFLSAAGLVFYLTIAVYSIIGKDFMKKQRIIYISLSGIILVTSIIFTTFKYLFGLYLYGTILFNAIILIKNIYKFDKKRKNIIIILILIVLVTLSIYFITMFQNMYYLLYKIPYIPIMYFVINLVGLIYIKKNGMHSGKNEDKKKEYQQDNEIENTTEVYIDEALKEYNITNRELEIITYVIKGYSNQLISEKLFISSHTVRNHIHNIYNKLNIKNRYELISFISNIQKSR